MEPLLSLDRLTVAFPRAGGWAPVVRDLSFSVGRGEFVGLVGESGCGKSVAALAVLGLVPPPGRVLGGRVLLEGENLLGLGPEALRRIRGGRIGFVFQEPAAALDPVFTIGYQIVEAIRAHRPVSRREARDRAVRLLDRVAMPEPARRLGEYPHRLSGGQRQRAMIAMALAAKPALLIADEPTTALDVTIQAQILELLEKLRRELGLAVLLITHDLAVVAETCERAVVMYAGEAVEEAGVEALFSAPLHPYTRGLLAAVPRLGAGRESRLQPISGRVPAPGALPPGCAFHPRCPEALEVCGRRQPVLRSLADGHAARCLLYDDEAGIGAG